LALTAKLLNGEIGWSSETLHHVAKSWNMFEQVAVSPKELQDFAATEELLT